MHLQGKEAAAGHHPHVPPKPEKPGDLEELLEEDFSSEADWRRMGTAEPNYEEMTETETEPTGTKHGHAHDDTHIHLEDIKDSDSSEGM